MGDVFVNDALLPNQAPVAGMRLTNRAPGIGRLLGVLLLVGPAGCAFAPRAPRHYLAITHPALNRLSFFDLDEQRTIGVLPTQKLPHDMLVSPDGRTLFVVASGSQCVSTYDLSAAELWRQAAAFMRGDSTEGGVRDSLSLTHPRVPMPGRRGEQAGPGRVGSVLNPDPVQALSPAIVRHFLTDTLVPPRALARHAQVGAVAHRACFDCHDRSVGGKPFGPVFSASRAEIYLVHLAYRNIAVLDARTAEIRRLIPLDIPTHYAPVEIWIAPGEKTAFVTCRDEIGASRPGRILVVDLVRGVVSRSIEAGIYPWHMLPDPSGRRLFVTSFQSSRISILDIERETIVDSIIVQNGPAAMAYLPGDRALAVACFYTDRVVIVDIDSRRIKKTIEVDSNPTSLEISTDGRLLRVLCGGESALDVVDLASGRVIERHKLLFGAYAFLRMTGA